MKILGIETSCDETSVAIVESSPPSRKATEGQENIKVLSNVVSSQVKIHAPYGGVVPSLAAREHQRNLVPVLITALRKAGLLKLKSSAFAKASAGKKNEKVKTEIKNKLEKIFEKEPALFKNFLKTVPKIEPPKIDLIAVTTGPGLEIALWNGINFARALAYIWGKPVLCINHLEAHIYSNWLPQLNKVKALRSFSEVGPALNLIVSGGHTQLVLMTGHGKFKILGETLDDAAGEAFDKVAKMMNLGYPGGPIISKLAQKGNPKRFNLPRPMLNQKNYNFSFAGLKTAVLYLLKKIKKLDQKTIADVAASFQQAAIDVLVAKTIRAAKEYKTKSILLSGGVSANKLLRKTLQKEARRLKVFYSQPDFRYTTDNAAMIALAGYYKNKNFPPTADQSKAGAAEPNLKIKNW